MSGKTPVLVMIQGHEPGARWKLQETRVTTIGRSSRNQISLVHPSVSRFHCEISYINGLWYIADLNSKKGTFLNGRQISDREVLKPGDVIRLSRNVFKFDLVDETAKEDEALLAIREASMGTEIREKGGGGDTLDKMRRRQQIEIQSQGDEPEQTEPGGLQRVVQKFGFLIAVALGVCLLTGVALAYGKQRSDRIEKNLKQKKKRAENALSEAVSISRQQPRPYREALEALRSVVENFSGYPEAAEAATIYRRIEREWFENEMRRMLRAERDGDYRESVEHCRTLLSRGGITNSRLKRIVQQHFEFTSRMAKIAFRKMDSRATELLDQGREKEAISLYREAIARIGVPDLVEEARRKIRRIESDGESDNGRGQDPGETSAGRDEQGRNGSEGTTQSPPGGHRNTTDSGQNGGNDKDLPDMDNLKLEPPADW